MSAYYNENDPFAAAWLRNLIGAGLIAPGDVDERSIVDVRAGDLAGYTQCHFFAGIGGWSYALRLAGWPDTRPVWTGSCPCQPFSSAGRRQGGTDERHLWPHWFHLISERRPPIIFGEQVARAIGKSWLDAVANDLEGEVYRVGAAVLPACAVGAPHIRDRVWFIADAIGVELRQQSRRRRRPGRRGSSQLGDHGASGTVADADSRRRAARNGNLSAAGYGDTSPTSSDDGDAARSRLAIGEGKRRNSRAELPAAIRANWWAVEPDVGRVAHGISARVDLLRGLGNAIVPQVAAEFIGAFLDTEGR